MCINCVQCSPVADVRPVSGPVVNTCIVSIVSVMASVSLCNFATWMAPAEFSTTWSPSWRHTDDDNALAPNEHLCFLCADHTVSILHCPGDPALIRSDNTVRNEISTIDLQSLSSYSKGLLKHSAALSLSFSPSLLLFPPFFCFSSSIGLLFLQLFLSPLPSLSSLLCPLLFSLLVFCAGEARA